MVLRMLMRQAFHDSGRAATIAQRMQNEQIGLGIGVLEAEFDPATADKTAAELVGNSVTKEFVRHFSSSPPLVLLMRPSERTLKHVTTWV